jgi:hypothetical protein
MKAASLNEIRKELVNHDQATLTQLCVALARFKKDNKELLSYLLFEAGNEDAYIRDVKHDVDELFEVLPKGNVYFVKKGIRKILRLLNKQIRYSGIPQTELDLRIHFCVKIKLAGIPIHHHGTVLYNLYQQQVKKIHGVLSKLPEDLQFDYAAALEKIK